MSIRIEILDLSSHTTSDVRAIAAMIVAYADARSTPVVRVATGNEALRIAAEDSPAAGAPVPLPKIAYVEPDEGIGGAITAEAAFGAPPVPNVAPFTAAAVPLLIVPAAPISIVPIAPPMPALPPVPSVATVAASVPIMPPAPGVALDSKGLPWDVRIHSSGRATVADGTWKMKRTIDPATVAQVEGELRQVMALPPRPPMPPEMLAPVAGWPFPTHSQLESIAAAVPIPTVPALASPTSGITTFPQIVSKITQAKTAGTMQDSHIQQALASVGITALPLLAVRQDLIPSVAAILDQLTAA